MASTIFPLAYTLPLHPNLFAYLVIIVVAALELLTHPGLESVIALGYLLDGVADGRKPFRHLP